MSSWFNVYISVIIIHIFLDSIVIDTIYSQMVTEGTKISFFPSEYLLQIQFTFCAYKSQNSSDCWCYCTNIICLHSEGKWNVHKTVFKCMVVWYSILKDWLKRGQTWRIKQQRCSPWCWNYFVLFIRKTCYDKACAGGRESCLILHLSCVNCSSSPTCSYKYGPTCTFKNNANEELDVSIN